MNLAERVAATEKVVARFRDRPFEWGKERTCIHLARAQMRALGHKPPTVPRFRSALTATRALKATGHDTLEGLLDSLLPRIAPAEMWVGDLALMEGEPPFHAIVIAAGGKVLGYHEDTPERGIVPIEVESFIGAWRL